MAEEMMTRKEFAKYLQVSLDTVDRSRKEGMPNARIRGMIRIPVNQAVAWMQDRAANGCKKKG